MAQIAVAPVATLNAGDRSPAAAPPPVTGADQQRFAQALAAPAAVQGTKATGNVAATRAADGVPAATAGTVRVSNGAELAQALAQARPGQRILLADGTYSAPSGAFQLKTAGTPSAPIVIQAEHPQGARLTSELDLAGSDQIASGLVMDGASVHIAGDRSRLTQSVVTNTDHIAVLVTKGADVRVDHNELVGLKARGISIKPDAANPGALVRPRIDHNWLHDFVGPQGENVHEPIQIGQGRGDKLISVQAVVEQNLLERVNVDAEAISLKSSDNVVRNNTLLDSQASIENRQGRRNQILGNWIENARGIKVMDRDTVVAGNRIIDSGGYGLRVMAGSIDTDSTDKGYPGAVGTRLVCNQADRVVVGDAYSVCNRPVEGVCIEGSQGATPTVTGLAQGTRTMAAPGGVPTAYRLGHADVGPGGTGSGAIGGVAPPVTGGASARYTDISVHYRSVSTYQDSASTRHGGVSVHGGSSAHVGPTPGERLLAGLARQRGGTAADDATTPAAGMSLLQLAGMLVANMNIYLAQIDRGDR